VIYQSRRRWAAVVATLAVTVVAAGCGSSSNSSSSAASSASSAAPPATSSSTSAAAPAASSGSGAGAGNTDHVTNYLSFIGGKAGKADASLTPVQIGWINQQGGTSSIGPLATTGAQMAVNYVNNELGGVDGHPIKLVTCFIQSAEEQGTTCGQQMLANKQISVINTGAVAIGIQSFFSTLGAAKPVITGVAATAVDAAQKNAIVLFGDASHVLGPLGTYGGTVLHAKTAAIIYANEPGLSNGAQAIAAALEKEGVKAKLVGYDESNPDLIGPLTSAGATTADMIIPQTDANGCVNMAKALKQLGITDAKKIVSNPLCLSGIVLKGLGDFPIWTYSIASSLYGDLSDPGEVAYHKVAAKYTTPGDAPDPWTQVGFGQMLTTIRFLNELGYGHITPAAVLAKAKSFTGPVPLGAPSLDCGKYPSAPGVCNDRTQFYTYSGKGKFVKSAGWLQPPS
jgi:branched-chain amino acid transport system substrate-binding protein